MKLLFATHNPNKVKELQSLLPKSIELLSLDDIGCTEEIPETSETIEGNALQKARYVKENYEHDCFADDTGLEVEMLNGEPGVYSARYAGEQKNDKANVKKLLAKLKQKKNRSAQLKTVVALILNGEEFLFQGICEGKIGLEPKGTNGFGYDPIFFPAGYDKTFAEISLDDKNKIGHRGKAVRKLIDFLSKK